MKRRKSYCKRIIKRAERDLKEAIWRTYKEYNTSG
jgi:hypothetical protein